MTYVRFSAGLRGELVAQMAIAMAEMQPPVVWFNVLNGQPMTAVCLAVASKIKRGRPVSKYHFRFFWAYFFNIFRFFLVNMVNIPSEKSLES